MSDTYAPRYKRDWYEAFLLKMNIVGWNAETRSRVNSFLLRVKEEYTGTAWRNFARECDEWLLGREPSDRINVTSALPHQFPYRRTNPRWHYKKPKEGTHT